MTCTRGSSRDGRRSGWSVVRLCESPAFGMQRSLVPYFSRQRQFLALVLWLHRFRFLASAGRERNEGTASSGGTLATPDVSIVLPTISGLFLDLQAAEAYPASRRSRSIRYSRVVSEGRFYRFVCAGLPLKYSDATLKIEQWDCMLARRPKSSSGANTHKCASCISR